MENWIKDMQNSWIQGSYKETQMALQHTKNLNPCIVREVNHNSFEIHHLPDWQNPKILHTILTRMRKVGLLYFAGGRIKQYRGIWQYFTIIQKYFIIIAEACTLWPTILSLRIYPTDLSALLSTDTIQAHSL